MLLLGTYEHSLDAKNRLTLPSKLVSKLPDNIVVSYGVDGCIELRTQEEFSNYCSTLLDLGAFDQKARSIQRFINSNSFELTIDNSNRVLLPNILLELAHITKEVTVIGVSNKVEIWDQETYKLKFEQTIPELALLMEEIGKNGKQ